MTDEPELADHLPPGEAAREWRQFRLLSRDSVRRLLDSALISREADPMQFALWGMTLAMTPPTIIAVQKAIKYAFLIRLNPAVVERIVVADRLFFIIYAMLATALLAALTWDALFPDRADQEIIGVLPVRPRTLAAARFAAAAGVGIGFALAISLPSALIFSLASSSHPLLGPLPRVFLGHLLSTTMACAFVFFTLLSLRGLAAICAGERIAERLALLLQLVTIVSLVEVFMFLPGVLPKLVRTLQSTENAYAWLPPVWFAGAFSAIAEGHGMIANHTGVALGFTALAAAVALSVSLLPAAWMGRRVLNSQARERAGQLTSLARGVAAVAWLRPAARSIFLFGIASIARSRRHAIVLATYLGLAVATSIVGVLTAGYRGTAVFHGPSSYLLTVPLAFLFFAVIGIRACMAIPTDIDANWAFRLSPPSVRQSLRASRLMVLTLGVVPISLTWMVVTLTLWPAADAVRVALFDLAAGFALTEAALSGWTMIPFASPRIPAPETVKSKLFLGVLALYLFTYRHADIQEAALQSMRGTLIYLGVAVLIVLGLRLRQTYQLRLRTPTLEITQDGIETLNLSEALN